MLEHAVRLRRADRRLQPRDGVQRDINTTCPFAPPSLDALYNAAKSAFWPALSFRGELTAEDDVILLGGSGEDVLRGGTGNDRLASEVGNDYLWRGAGAGTFIHGVQHGIDRIRDFADNVVSLSLTAWNFSRSR